MKNILLFFKHINNENVGSSQKTDKIIVISKKYLKKMYPI